MGTKSWEYTDSENSKQSACSNKLRHEKRRNANTVVGSDSERHIDNLNNNSGVKDVYKYVVNCARYPDRKFGLPNNCK